MMFEPEMTYYRIIYVVGNGVNGAYNIINNGGVSRRQTASVVRVATDDDIVVVRMHHAFILL